jgi:hypothetical protein
MMMTRGIVLLVSVVLLVRGVVTVAYVLSIELFYVAFVGYDIFMTFR